MKPLYKSLYKSFGIGLVVATVFGLTACQSLPKPATETNTADVIKFEITGKIGVTSQTPNGTQAGSAFYTWGQEDERFAIDLTGALGIGATAITFDGQVAQLTSEKTGTLQADTPEELLLKATGWQAPISQLPHWILGRASPDDVYSVINDDGKLTQSTNGDWKATFDYDNQKHQHRPSRLTMIHGDGHKVVMTIVYP